MERSKKQISLLKKSIKVIDKADVEIYDLTIKLMLLENPEVDRFVRKQKDIDFTLISDDFLACSEPMVKKLYHLSNHLESLKNFIDKNYSDLRLENFDKQ